jgi:4-diphosphocytidyl-2-C-methyl-D-erythritol kinase
VLIGINELYGLKLSKRELLEIAVKIGADVSFFLGDGAAKVTGIGERIIPLNIKAKLNLVILKPEQSLSTPKVFKAYDKQGIRGIKDSGLLIDALERGDIAAVSRTLGNDLQQAAQELCPEIERSINWLMENGAKAAVMTGSGSCVFGIYESEKAAQEACRSYDGGGTAYAVHTVDKPVEML